MRGVAVLYLVSANCRGWARAEMRTYSLSDHELRITRLRQKLRRPGVGGSELLVAAHALDFCQTRDHSPGHNRQHAADQGALIARTATEAQLALRLPPPR